MKMQKTTCSLIGTEIQQKNLEILLIMNNEREDIESQIHNEVKALMKK